MGTIALDPATAKDNPTGATEFYWGNGLDAGWAIDDPDGLVFVNPPYGRNITSKWTAKMAYEGRLGVEIIGLLPARPSTIWWHDHVLQADALAFFKGRIRFAGADSGAPFPSVLVYWGRRKARFHEIFNPRSWVVMLDER